MKKLSCFICTLLLLGCQGQQAPQEEAPPLADNPPAAGFRMAESDEKAIAIADEVMEAMGGRYAWDTLQTLQWTFFGRRHLLWDKAGQQARIEYPEKERVVWVNLADDSQGMAWDAGVEVGHPDTLVIRLQWAKSVWINDMYWLCMPFKLKDSGVALKYARADTTMTGDNADVLALTFEGVGNTPENKYEVWVDKNSHLAVQWAYFKQASQDSANFITPWAAYRQYGHLQFSSNRGRANLENIALLGKVPDAVWKTGEMILPLDK